MEFLILVLYNSLNKKLQNFSLMLSILSLYKLSRDLWSLFWSLHLVSSPLSIFFYSILWKEHLTKSPTVQTTSKLESCSSFNTSLTIYLFLVIDHTPSYKKSCKIRLDRVDHVDEHAQPSDQCTIDARSFDHVKNTSNLQEHASSRSETTMTIGLAPTWHLEHPIMHYSDRPRHGPAVHRMPHEKGMRWATAWA